MTTTKSAVDEVDATEPTQDQRVDVTAVLPDIVAGEALREQAKDLAKRIKVHEDAIKDALGEAAEGVNSLGEVVVRYPIRNRTNLDKSKVKSKLSEEDYAACEQVTTYRQILYGKG